MRAHFEWLVSQDAETRSRVVRALEQSELNAFAHHWGMKARDAQFPPPGNWRIWLIMAGRGFGKTRAGSEWVRMIADTYSDARIALVSASLAEARAVMVEGESGLLTCSPPGQRPTYDASLRRVRFGNGAVAQLFSAAEPESLRGPQFSHAWCDEVGKWPLSHDRATRAWDNLAMGLRLGKAPQIAVTTTPRAVPLVQRLLDGETAGTTVVTRGSTFDNKANLSPRFLEAIDAEYGASQLARQEIDGEMLADIEGALWNRALIERCRDTGSAGEYRRIVIAVDPPISAAGDECGIIVAGLDTDGVAHVLADCSVARAQPDQWARAVADAASQWRADRVVAEANQGGAMVESVLRAADSTLPVKLVHASRGKVARAEPVAALYASVRVKHRGNFAQLEDQMCGMMTGGEYVGPNSSPDRADALVWAMHELMLGRTANPSVRHL